jgi:hypothetical protein
MLGGGLIGREEGGRGGTYCWVGAGCGYVTHIQEQQIKSHTREGKTGRKREREAPQSQFLQAGQEAQRRSNGGSAIRADAVVAAKTEGAGHGLQSSGGVHRMRHGLWRGLSAPPPSPPLCSARVRLHRHAWGSLAGRPLLACRPSKDTCSSSVCGGVLQAVNASSIVWV